MAATPAVPAAAGVALPTWVAPMLAPRPVRYIAEPNPGSDEAYEAGCTCSREANNDGDGLVFGGFVITPDCPIHDPEDDAA